MQGFLDKTLFMEPLWNSVNYQMKLLSIFLNIFRNRQPTVPVPSAEVDGSEDISRIIFNKNEFSKDKMLVKYSAFLPADDGKASVLRSSGLTEDQVWKIDADVISGKRSDGRQSKSRAAVLASNIVQVGVEIEVDPIERRIERALTHARRRLRAIEIERLRA